MTKEPDSVAEARAAADHARTRLMGTAQELQHRLSPGTIARNGWESAKEKGAVLAEDAVDAVRSRPVTSGSIAAAIALFLAREPIIDGASRLIDGVSTKRRARRTRKAGAASAKAAAKAESAPLKVETTIAKRRPNSRQNKTESSQ